MLLISSTKLAFLNLVHCWDYRRFCSKQKGSTIKEEFDFTTKKVEDNFSNYSAWHQRSVLLPLLFENDQEGFKQALQEEFELIKNAFYTEPNDQSAWFYHRWLRFQYCGQDLKNFKKKENLELLQKEVESLKELLKEEPNAKWVILTITQMLQEIGNPDDQKQILDSFKKLEEIDSDHQSYYQYLSKKSQ